MTQRIQGDQFGRPACLAAFAVSMGVFFAAITGSLWPPRAGSVWPPFDSRSGTRAPGAGPRAEYGRVASWAWTFARKSAQGASRQAIGLSQ